MIRRHKYREEMPMETLYKYCIELIENNTIVHKEWQQFSFFPSYISNMKDNFKYIELKGYNDPHLFLNTADQLYELITRRIKYKNIKSMILHLFINGIDTHVDSISKKCFLIPVKCSKDSIFHESSYDIDLNSLSNTHYISFNDYNLHGIYSDSNDRNIVISID